MRSVSCFAHFGHETDMHPVDLIRDSSMSVRQKFKFNGVPEILFTEMPKQVRKASANHMFSKDDIIFSYTTKQAVVDGVLIKTDSKLSSEAAILFPVYFTSAVWEKYVKVPEQFKDSQNLKGRLWDILFMFAFRAKNCSGSVLPFRFNCRIPQSKPWSKNEKKSGISFQHRDVVLKAVITAQDIDDPSPAIFIMLPWED
jgi:hypothetical protein